MVFSSTEVKRVRTNPTALASQHPSSTGSRSARDVKHDVKHVDVSGSRVSEISSYCWKKDTDCMAPLACRNPWDIGPDFG